MNKFIYFFIDSGDNHGGYAEPPPPDYSEVATDSKYKQSQRLYYNSESDTTSDSDYDVHQTHRNSPQHQRHTSRTRRHRSRSNRGKNIDDNSLHYHDDEVTCNQDHSDDDYDKIYYCGGGEYEGDEWEGYSAAPQYDEYYEQKLQNKQSRSAKSSRNKNSRQHHSHGGAAAVTRTDSPVGVHFSSSASNVTQGKYHIPPAPSPLNGPYYQGKLRPEYRHMSGPPYPALYHLGESGHQLEEKTSYDEGGSHSHSSRHKRDNGMHVEQIGHVTRVTYDPDRSPVTYIDSPDGNYGNDWMCLSVLNFCFCAAIFGAIGIALSMIARHFIETGRITAVLLRYD